MFFFNGRSWLGSCPSHAEFSLAASAQSQGGMMFQHFKYLERTWQPLIPGLPIRSDQPDLPQHTGCGGLTVVIVVVCCEGLTVAGYEGTLAGLKPAPTKPGSCICW
ncbi:unnamed protein product [Polarella glacialis]|uniref:Uncharacterized protein n=1 Tax=Polarella glacialis TaxID=89957 RepID=A0A813I5E7_POLGL|nr:unnamed protein product [Polarella glacialis]CAE8696319.1 unnamed protein product [Polarella glacialis]